YSVPNTFNDPASGYTATYYTVCAGCQRPSGIGNITMTNMQYTTYKGVTVSATKRFSNRWQMASSVTFNRLRNFQPLGSYTNPTGVEFTNGFAGTPNGNPRYSFKMNGSVQLPFGLNASANLNVNDGNVRTLTINGPGNVYGGVSSTGAATTIAYNTLTF